MKHTHITFVGGQSLPVYLGIKNFEHIDCLIFIHSSQTKRQAEHLGSLVQVAEIQYIPCSSENFIGIEQKAQQLLEAHHEEEVSINLTGGVKPWGLIFSKVFARHPHLECIYVDQNNKVTQLSDYSTKSISIPVEMRFRVNQTDLPTYRSLSEYTDADFDDVRRLEKLRRVDFDAFQALTNAPKAPWKDKVEGEVRPEKGNQDSYLAWNKKEHWIEISLYNNKGEEVLEEFTGPHAFETVFNYAWFEIKTALELRKNPMVKKIWVNCVFNASEGGAKNEIDIIADMETKLYFVECKTMVHDITDIDKFKTAMRNYSGLGSKGIFVTLYAPSEKRGKIYRKAEEKCRDNQVAMFNFGLKQKNPSLPSLNEIILNDLDGQNPR